MSLKQQVVKDALASMKKKGVAQHASVNPAVETEEQTPGIKKPLSLKGNKGGPAVKSNVPFWQKPKGTAENPINAEKPGQSVAIKKKTPAFFQKAKTR